MSVPSGSVRRAVAPRPWTQIRSQASCLILADPVRPGETSRREGDLVVPGDAPVARLFNFGRAPAPLQQQRVALALGNLLHPAEVLIPRVECGSGSIPRKAVHESSELVDVFERTIRDVDVHHIDGGTDLVHRRDERLGDRRSSVDFSTRSTRSPDLTS